MENITIENLYDLTETIAAELFTEAEDKSVERYEHLLRLKDLFAPKAD